MRNWIITDDIAAWGYPVCCVGGDSPDRTMGEMGSVAASLLAAGANPHRSDARAFFVSWVDDCPVVWTEPAPAVHTRTSAPPCEPEMILTTAALFKRGEFGIMDWSPPSRRRLLQVRAIVYDLARLGMHPFQSFPFPDLVITPPSNPNCRWCGGTGQVTLATTIKPCLDC